MSTFLLNAALPSEILRPPCDDTLDLASALVVAETLLSHASADLV